MHDRHTISLLIGVRAFEEAFRNVTLYGKRCPGHSYEITKLVKYFPKRESALKAVQENVDCEEDEGEEGYRKKSSNVLSDKVDCSSRFLKKYF